HHVGPGDEDPPLVRQDHHVGQGRPVRGAARGGAEHDRDLRYLPGGARHGREYGPHRVQALHALPQPRATRMPHPPPPPARAPPPVRPGRPPGAPGAAPSRGPPTSAAPPARPPAPPGPRGSRAKAPAAIPPIAPAPARAPLSSWGVSSRSVPGSNSTASRASG